MKLEKNWIEWSVFAGSTIVIAACIAMLVTAILRGGDGPPSLHLSTAAASPVTGGFRVPVKIRNEGHATAEAVHVAVTLESRGATVESAVLEFAFVPHDSARTGFVTFRRDPRCCDIVARADGFTQP